MPKFIFSFVLLLSLNVQAADGPCAASLKVPGVRGVRALLYLRSLEKSEGFTQLYQSMRENNGVFEIAITPPWLRGAMNLLEKLPVRRFASWNKALPQPFVFVANPEVTDAILQTPENYLRTYDPLRDRLGETSFFLLQDAKPEERQQWMTIHKAVVGGFTPAFVKNNYEPLFKEELDRLNEAWRARIVDGAIEGAEREIDVFAIRLGYRAFTGADLDGAVALSLLPYLDTVLSRETPPDFYARLSDLLRPAIERCASEDCTQNILGKLIETRAVGNLPESWIYDQLITLLFAAQETTRFALGMSLVELSGRPEWQARLRGQDPASPIAQAFVNEVLRVHPPVPIFPRIAAVPVQTGAYKFPANTIFEISVEAQHSNPALWGANALEFYPERWLAERMPERRAFCAFGGGTRMCVGATFALSEIRWFVADILNRWELLPLEQKPSVGSGGGIQRLTSPLNLRLQSLD